MKKERKKRMQMLMGEANSDDEMTFEGLDKVRTDRIIDWLQEMRNTYSKNNRQLDVIDKSSHEIVMKNDETKTLFKKGSSKYKLNKPGTPRFK